MELDTFLTSPRWDILRTIIEKPSSPTEIAQYIETSTSFVSQQLKLLEAANLIKKQRTGAVDKGKPRSLFSITKESVYIVPLAKGFEEKQLIELSAEQKVTLKIWEMSRRFQPILEKFFWKIHDNLGEIDSILVNIKGKKCKVQVVTKDKSVTHLINEAKINRDEQLVFQVTASSSLPRSEEDNFVPIYVSETKHEKEQLKGGLK